MQVHAMLAIWSDIAEEHELDYLHWLTREHTTERVSTAGFKAVRVFRAMHWNVRRYFICYDLETSAVVNSPEYLAKLNDPTPWSRRIMPRLSSFRRGGGPIRAQRGIGQGALLSAIALDAEFPPDAGAAVAELIEDDGIAAVRVMEIDQVRTSTPTREKSMRKHDGAFAGLILIEGMREQDVLRARERLAVRRPGLVSAEERTAPLYQQVFSLQSLEPSPGASRPALQA